MVFIHLINNRASLYFQNISKNCSNLLHKRRAASCFDIRRWEFIFCHACPCGKIINMLAVRFPSSTRPEIPPTWWKLCDVSLSLSYIKSVGCVKLHRVLMQVDICGQLLKHLASSLWIEVVTIN